MRRLFGRRVFFRKGFYFIFGRKFLGFPEFFPIIAVVSDVFRQFLVFENQRTASNLIEEITVDGK